MDKALTHLYKGIFISDDFNWHPNFAGITETLIASTYAKQNNVDSVRKYILLADKIKRDELPVPYKARIKSLMALSLAYEGNFEEGRKLLDEAYKVASEGKDSSEMMYSEFIRGKIFAKARQYGKAIAAYNHVLDDYSEKDLESYITFVLLDLIDAYRATDQDQKAFAAYEILLDQLKSQKISNQQLYIEELNYNMRFNENLAELEKLKSSNEKAQLTRSKNNMLIAALAVFLALLIVILFLVVKAKKT